MWNSRASEGDKATIWSACSDPLNQTRPRALSVLHAGGWLATLPLVACGLGLSAVRVAAGFRRGLCSTHHISVIVARSLTRVDVHIMV